MVARARAQVALLVNATPEEIVWTSGATESDNLALIGAARFRAGAGRHIVTTAIEHPAVLDTCRYLEREGFDVTYVEADASGVVDPESVRAALRPDTTLVSVMHVNNEIGTIQDIGAIGHACRERGALLHVDAAQSAGRLPLDVDAQKIDLLSLSAHKLYGPKGVGALYLNRQRIGRVEPLCFGGGQERGLRPGTVPTHQVVGMGLAFEIARERRADDAARLTGLRDRLWAGLSSMPGVLLNGDPSRRVYHILSVSGHRCRGRGPALGAARSRRIVRLGMRYRRDGAVGGAARARPRRRTGAQHGAVQHRSSDDRGRHRFRGRDVS